MISFSLQIWISKNLSGIFSINSPCAKWEPPLKDPQVSIVGLCDESGNGSEKKSWISNLCRGQRRLTERNLSHCCNGYNYTKKRAVRLNYPWYSPWVMTEIQKVKWHRELNDFWHYGTFWKGNYNRAFMGKSNNLHVEIGLKGLSKDYFFEHLCL